MYKNITVVFEEELIKHAQSLGYDMVEARYDLEVYKAIPEENEGHAFIEINTFESSYKEFKKLEKLTKLLETDLKNKKKIKLSHSGLDSSCVCSESKYEDLFYAAFLDFVEILPDNKENKLVNLKDVKTIFKELKSYYLGPIVITSFMKKHKIKECVVIY